MNRCLHCHELFFEPVGWRKILLLDEPALLCQVCEDELILISGQRCKGCSRSLDKLPEKLRKDDQCLDCWRWQQKPDTTNLLEKNVSLYEYNPFLKDWLATFKYRGDAVIATYFSPKLEKLYQKNFKGYVPVAIPLSQERLTARGFNQSQLLMNNWTEEKLVLTRRYGEKQSKKSRSERIRQFQENPFVVDQPIKGSIVLVDDIYTTGTTVRQVALKLLENGASQVASLTIAR
ncbi:ComF family protein [Halalkalibacter akibai]|uniref:Late competence protein n=1 Tax=Halalkalibacter akibai (strain ATCC 43226 / DSM 21942 / CIP 109018 / JCM 9157 / 1139) TaxID=1236973 RepID=W4QLN5_HALA3|nr:ComF family protein [Halalkalibacter akibai]GAE33025.1 late competence protein [Halalkalibacter akibai JCM 9157]